jgi:predicted nucleotidyltransferase component of viral defense system
MRVDERDSVAVQFGVSPEQVERDHLISHLLAAISRGFGDRLPFIGGTALARTYLVSGRLSESIDLIALANRAVLAADLDAALPVRWYVVVAGRRGVRRPVCLDRPACWECLVSAGLRVRTRRNAR